ncbi:hypothetical protein [Cognatishimia activa]|nr:hypothetical protein [Cognatishimia activa]
MQFLASTPVAAVLFLLMIYLGPHRGLWVMFMTLPFGAAAALQVPGFGNVMMTDACLVALWLSMFGRVRTAELVSQLVPGHPGFALFALLIWTTLSAGFNPTLYAHGTEVFAVVQGERGALIDTVPLRPSGSNVGQLLRMVLGVTAFVAVSAITTSAGAWRLVWRAMSVATIAHISVSLLDWFGHALGFQDLLSPFRSVSQAVLSDQNFPGLRRIIGGYTEPASFGLFTMGLVGFWMRAAISKCCSRHAWIYLSVLVILALRSTSSATILNLILVSTLFLLFNHSAIFARRSRVVICMSFFAALPTAYAIVSLYLGYSPMGSDLMDAMIWDKARSSSGEERALWNDQAVRNFFDTGGLGAGIGSARSSGWAFAVLSNIGLPGLLLFGWFLSALFCTVSGAEGGTRSSEIAASCRWGCLALLLQSCLTRPYPDLGVFFFAMAGIAVGLSQKRNRNAERALLRRPRVLI